MVAGRELEDAGPPFVSTGAWPAPEARWALVHDGLSRFAGRALPLDEQVYHVRATFAPRLDAAGNSVNGQRIARLPARRLGLDLLASAPAPPERAS